MRRSFIIFIISISAPALGALAACGGGHAQIDNPEQAAVQRRFPVLALAPEQPSYALVSQRTTDLVTGAREFMMAMGLIGGFDISTLDSHLQQSLGFNPWSLDDLADAGVATDQSAVVFSRGFLPTFVIPIADPAKLQQFLDKHRPGGRLSVRRYRDHEWFSFRYRDHEWFSFRAKRDLAVQWIHWSGFLAVRIAPKDDIESVDWLDELFDKSRSLARSGVMARALADVSAHVPEASMAGHLDIRAVLGAVLELAPADEREALRSCLDVFKPLAGSIDGSIAVAATLDRSSAQAALTLGLTPQAAAALRAHVLRQPAGYDAIRADAGVYASFNVDLMWLDGVRQELRCPFVNEPWSHELDGLAAAVYQGTTGAFGALLDADIEERSAHALGYVGLRDRSLVDQLLRLIPQRRLLERNAEVAGRKVKVVALPFVPKLTYDLDDRGILLALGDGVMERLADARPAHDDPGARPEDSAMDAPLDLASLGIRPATLRNLDDLLVAVAEYLGYSPDFARASYRRLARYQHGTVDLTLDKDALVLRLSMGLRP